MAAEAALRAGVGLVTVASAASAIPMMAPRLSEAMWEPLPETPSGAIAFGAAERLDELLSGPSGVAALAIGPGLGLDDETVRVVQKLVSECPHPMVIDADALNALQNNKDAIQRGKPVALTPHPGEAARLLGCTTAEVQRDRLQAVRGLAAGVKAHVLLKGYRSLISEPGGRTVVNITGNPGLATAGSGDVLTGIIGGLIAQGASVEDALIVGAYVHGLAGDLAAAELGETSLIATDVIEKLAAAIQSLRAD
jgi:NAD(P)H-hydrate epimerase